MDERIATLIDAYPKIFEAKVQPVGELDDEFVIINVPGGDSDENLAGLLDSSISVNDELISDPHFWDNSGSTLDRPDYLTERHGDPWERLINEYEGLERGSLTYRLRRRVKGKFPGTLGGPPPPPGNFAPPPDALAFYLPFHRYPDYWGIYLINTGVQLLSLALEDDLRIRSAHSYSPIDCRTIATAYLYHHEAYHSAIEAFAVRCELPMRKPFYRTGLRTLYNRSWIPGTRHEETLASAYGLRKVLQNLKMPGPKIADAVDSLKRYLLCCPPVYAAGVDYVDEVAFKTLERQFQERAINENPGSKLVLNPSAWQIGTYLLSPLLQRNRKYSWICDRNDFRVRSSLAVHYFRRRDVVRCLSRLGNAYEEAGGRHIHLVRKTESGVSRRTQVPSGEIHRGTLGAMLKDLDLNLNVHNFREQCRDAGAALS